MTDTHDNIGFNAVPFLATEWVTDAELIRRSGVPEKIMRRLLRSFDANPNSGFPRKDKVWGDRRHYPSIQDYWREQQRRRMTPSHIRRAS